MELVDVVGIGLTLFCMHTSVCVCVCVSTRLLGRSTQEDVVCRRREEMEMGRCSS
jgi:hypothetical protein